MKAMPSNGMIDLTSIRGGAVGAVPSNMKSARGSDEWSDRAIGPVRATPHPSRVAASESLTVCSEVAYATPAEGFRIDTHLFTQPEGRLNRTFCLDRASSRDRWPCMPSQAQSPKCHWEQSRCLPQAFVPRTAS